MNVLDLFCGACGGWSLGLDRAGFDTVAACEIDEWRRRQFSRNFPRTRMYDDVRTITAERLRDDGIAVDLVCGSPPCQDASTANTTGRGIEGERTGLYLEAVRIVLEVRPRWYAFENVPGIRNRGIDRVLSLLEQGGYSAWPLVVGASNLGAPHIRKRSIVIGADAATVQRLALPWDQPDRNSEFPYANAARFGWRGNEPGRQEVWGNSDAARFASDAVTDTEGSGGRAGLRQAGPFSDGTVAGDGSEPSADTSCGGRQRIGRQGKAGTAERHQNAGQSRCAGLEIERGEPGHNGPELSPLERAITARCGAIAENWNGGIAGRLRMDDGVPKGMARPLLAAYGDAFIPQIPEIVGRAIQAADRAMMRPKRPAQVQEETR